MMPVSEQLSSDEKTSKLWELFYLKSMTMTELLLPFTLILLPLLQYSHEFPGTLLHLNDLP